MNKPKKCSRDSAPRPAPVWTVSRIRFPQCGPARIPHAPVSSALTQISSVDPYIVEFTWSICTTFLGVPVEVMLNDMGKLTTTRHKKVRYGYPLTHFSRDTIVAIWQNIFSNVFSRMKSSLFWIEFHLRLFLRVQLKISEYWFSYWLGTEQATSHNMKQYWPSSLTHIFGTMGRSVNWHLVYIGLWSEVIYRPKSKRQMVYIITWSNRICVSNMMANMGTSHFLCLF